MKKITVRTVFRTTDTVLWGLVEQTNTLFFETSGLVEFDKNMFPKYWGEKEDQTIVTTIKPLGFGRGTPYFITVKRADPNAFTIRTSEQGGAVNAWEHTRRIRLESFGGCSLIDEIEIDAGWVTWFYVGFAKVYYRIRHRRLRHLLGAGK